MERIPSGFLLIDKPAGVSSFDVLRLLKKRLYTIADLATHSPSDRKSEFKKHIRDLALGHCGTLDPFATGLLIVGVGKATKLSQYFLSGKKVYRATLKFGAKTTSGDLTNEVIATTEKIPLDQSEVARRLTEFTVHPYFQTPPMTSAKKVGGEKLYVLERQGITVDRLPELRQVTETKVHSYLPPLLDFEVKVSSGTYIRVLGEDLAEKCGSLGHLVELRRLESSRFNIEAAIPVDRVTGKTFSDLDLELSCKTSSPREAPRDSGAFIPFDSVFSNSESMMISDSLAQELRLGRQGVLASLPLPAPDSFPAAIPLKLESSGKLLTLIRYRTDKMEWRTDHVFSDLSD